MSRHNVTFQMDNSAKGTNVDKKTNRPKKMLNDPRFKIKPMQQVVSASAGAMITACFMTPLDVIKTRMQSQQPQQSQPSKYFLYCNGLMDHLCSFGSQSHTTVGSHGKPQFNSTMDALIKISRIEGISALWSGLGPTLVSALPSTVIYFVAYEQFKFRYTALEQKYFANPASLHRDQRQNEFPVLVPMFSGITARICAVTFVSPIELIRTKMQSQRLSYAQVMLFVRNVIAVHGIIGLWRGLRPTILRDVPFSGIYWPIYEYLKIIFNSGEQPSFGFSFFAGVVAGSMAALATCPFDVVKTHEQIEFGKRVIFTDSPTKEVTKQSTFKRLLNIYRTFGLRGLFAGYGPRLIKVAPACAIMISTFEYSKMYFFYYNVEQYNSELLQSNPNAELVKEDDIE